LALVPAIDRNTATPAISEVELDVVRAELARHQHPRFHRVEAVKDEIVVFEPSHRRYAPVMKFMPAEQAGEYAVHRMTYRGDGGWSWFLAVGPLKTLAKRYLGKIGTEAFFELGLTELARGAKPVSARAKQYSARS